MTFPDFHILLLPIFPLAVVKTSFSYSSFQVIVCFPLSVYILVSNSWLVWTGIYHSLYTAIPNQIFTFYVLGSRALESNPSAFLSFLFFCDLKLLVDFCKASVSASSMIHWGILRVSMPPHHKLIRDLCMSCINVSLHRHQFKSPMVRFA